VEIETAKSLVELPSPYAGTVAELHVAEGQTVEVGTPIISIAPVGVEVVPQSFEPPAAEADSQVDAQVGTPSQDEPVEPGLEGSPAPGASTPTLVGYGPRKASAKRRPRKTTQPAAAAQSEVDTAFTPGVQRTPEPESGSTSAPEPEPSTGGEQPSPKKLRALAKPPVRKLAKDLGVDLLQVTPTGTGGVVTREDVQTHANGALAAPAAQQPIGGETRIPIKGVRKWTAEAMVSSAFTAPHVTEWVTVDVTRTMDLVDRLKEDRAFSDVRVSPLLVLMKAVCLALRHTREVNSTWDEDAQQIVLKDYVNLGIATATP